MEKPHEKFQVDTKKMDDLADGAQLAAELMKLPLTNPERIDAALFLLESHYRSLFDGFTGGVRIDFVRRLLKKKERIMKYDIDNSNPYFAAGVGVAEELMRLPLTEEAMAKIAIKLLYSPQYLPLFWEFTGTCRVAFVKQLIS